MGGVAAIIKSRPDVFKKVNKPAPIATTIAPTAAEISQSTATDAAYGLNAEV